MAADATIVDYGMGNIGSIANMIRKAGASAEFASNPEQLARAKRIILPGVGSFDQGRRRLDESGLSHVLSQFAEDQRIPILGICLGAQLMTRCSEEGSLPGFGWIPARTVRFRFGESENQPRVPHMGWNWIEPRKASPLLEGLPGKARFYFLHSYHFECEEPAVELCRSEYGYEFPSALATGPITAVQFHPEKSHRFGLALMRNFLVL